MYCARAIAEAAIERANRWTIGQAARLQTTPAVILEAIRRGPWLPEQLEQVRSKYELEGDPPQLEAVEPWIDQEIDRKLRANTRNACDVRSGERRAKNTAMAAAYQKANGRAASAVAT